MIDVLAFSNTIIIGMSVLISGVNAILRIVLGQMASLQAKHTLTD
jgi:hypothetical protein